MISSARATAPLECEKTAVMGGTAEGDGQ